MGVNYVFHDLMVYFYDDEKHAQFQSYSNNNANS